MTRFRNLYILKFVWLFMAFHVSFWSMGMADISEKEGYTLSQKKTVKSSILKKFIAADSDLDSKVQEDMVEAEDFTPIGLRTHSTYISYTFPASQEDSPYHGFDRTQFQPDQHSPPPQR